MAARLALDHGDIKAEGLGDDEDVREDDPCVQVVPRERLRPRSPPLKHTPGTQYAGLCLTIKTSAHGGGLGLFDWCKKPTVRTTWSR